MTAQWELPLARGHTWPIEGPQVMGILNLTPDSFSDGGQITSEVDALARVARWREQGVRLIDVGGESTRPGHEPVSAGEETRRVVPVIRAIREEHPDAIISIDTSKAAVAEAALEAGADLVNDVSGLADPDMTGVVVAADCAYVAMRSQPLVGDPVEACREQLAALRRQCVREGIADRAIILDPGLGFGDPPGADVDANLALVDAGDRLAAGRPLLVGASRKRFIGTMQDEPDPRKRAPMSVEVAVRAVRAGAAIVRVHDVRATVEGLRAAGLLSEQV